jgi:hypothetical protein
MNSEPARMFAFFLRFGKPSSLRHPATSAVPPLLEDEQTSAKKIERNGPKFRRPFR